MNSNYTETSPKPLIHNPTERIIGLFEQYVVPTYKRFPLVFERGSGPYLWDIEGRRFLDLGGGIAVNLLGHAHPKIIETVVQQTKRLLHVSNYYYCEVQARLAQELCQRIGPGKVFFCNSGAEANETLFKLARKWGAKEGRFEIISAYNSFHGRTLAGIAATGQEKVKKGFEPMPTGFRHVPFNDLEAIEQAISPATVAIIIEGIQGEGGINIAEPEFLIGLRKLCDEYKLLLLMDEVQCGQYRTGMFHSYQRILEKQSYNFIPDGVSMAKGLGNGFPIGAVWIRAPYADVLGPGSHGNTFGGNPLACAVALSVLEVISQEHLDQNARMLGTYALDRLQRLAYNFPQIIQNVRGLGLMIGIELSTEDRCPIFKLQSSTPPSIQFIERLHQYGVLAIPAGSYVIRLLPPLNITQPQLDEGLQAIEEVVKELASQLTKRTI